MHYPDYITRLDAVVLIAERTRPQHEPWRAWKNKINAQIKYKIKIGKLTINTDNQIFFAELSDYVKEKYPGVFDDWPTTPALGKATLLGFSTLNVIGFCEYSNNLEECHQQILRMNSEVEKLKLMNCELQAEIERLKPAAERFWEIKEINRVNASKRQ